MVSGQELTPEDRSQILETMKQQEQCWNKGNLECYMEGYWQSDSLRFIGSRGLTFGWETTLNNYRRSYPDAAAMGYLTFEILSVEGIGPHHILVLGKWAIERPDGNLSGHYSLIWKKINGAWKIIVDHSS